MILQVAYIRSNDSTLVIRSMALVDCFPWWKAQGFLVPDVAHGRHLWTFFFRPRILSGVETWQKLLGQMGFETLLPNFGMDLFRKWKLSGGPYKKFLDLLTLKNLGKMIRWTKRCDLPIYFKWVEKKTLHGWAHTSFKWSDCITLTNGQKQMGNG